VEGGEPENQKKPLDERKTTDNKVGSLLKPVPGFEPGKQSSLHASLPNPFYNLLISPAASLIIVKQGCQQVFE